VKKTIIAIVVWELILGGVVPLLQAKEKPISVYFNLGGVWNVWIFPQYMTLGLQVDVHLGKLLMLSPEFNVWSEGFRFDSIYLAPGAVLNFTFGRFFAGGGFTAMRYDSKWVIDKRWETRFKFNIGYRTRHFKLIAAAVPASGYFYGVITAGLGF
jgi:hypothetical protein